MVEFLKTLFVTIFGTHSRLATMIISMIPIIELRGGIPIGVDKGLWGENALSLFESFFWSILGCSIICVILTFAFSPIFNWLKTKKWCKKLTDLIEEKLSGKSKDIEEKSYLEKNERKAFLIKFFGVLIFVAIPLPGTGVWTGTCLALFIGLDKKWTILSVLLGNLIAGIIMTFLSFLFAGNTMILFVAFLALVAVFALVALIRRIIKNSKNKTHDTESSL